MENNLELKHVINLVFKAVGIAMGIAVVVLNLLKSASLDAQILLLGIGLFGLAAASLDREDTHD